MVQRFIGSCLRLCFWIILLFFALIGCTQVGASLLQGSDPAAAIYRAPILLPTAIQQLAFPLNQPAERPIVEIHVPAVEHPVSTEPSITPSSGGNQGQLQVAGQNPENQGQSPAEPDPAPPQQQPSPAEAACIPDLIFLEDLTIPDGTLANAGAELDKRWQVRNNGTCDWNQDFRLRNVSGAAMGASSEQALYPARRGSEAMIRIRFIAPDEPGTHRSVWQAHTSDGKPFGDTFYFEIVVEAP